MPLSINLTLEYADDTKIKVAWDEKDKDFKVVNVEGERVAKEFWKLFNERTGNPDTNVSKFVRDNGVLDGAYIVFEEPPYILIAGKTIRIYNFTSSKAKQAWVWKDTIKGVAVVTTDYVR